MQMSSMLVPKESTDRSRGNVTEGGRKQRRYVAVIRGNCGDPKVLVSDDQKLFGLAVRGMRSLGTTSRCLRFAEAM